MDDALNQRLIEELIKSVPQMPLMAGISFDQDNATILLTKYKRLSEGQQNAVVSLLANLYVYLIYRQEQFLDPHLFGEIQDFPSPATKELRQFALGYLQTGGLIDVKDGRIHILSEQELRGFGGMHLAMKFMGKLFEKDAANAEQATRYLHVEEMGLGLRLLEVQDEAVTPLCKLQSDGLRRKFFEECWKNAGTKISFDHFYRTLPLGKEKKIRPSEYLKALKFQEGDRFHRYAYVDTDEGYVYFQKHYSPEPLTKSVLQQYSNQ